MAVDPCIDLLGVFEQQIKDVGGDEMWERYQGASVGEKIKMADHVMEELNLRARQTKLRGMAWARLSGFLEKRKGDMDKALNDLVSGGGVRQSGTISLENRIDAIMGQAHSELYQMMEAYRPRKFGLANNREFFRNIIREMFEHGSTADKDAAQYASMIKTVTEKLRQRFNRAGGGIQKLFDWNLPQYHDAVKIQKVDFKTWFDDVKDLIDRRRAGAYQVDGGEIKGVEMSDDQFKYFMEGIYDNLRSDGFIKHKNVKNYNPHIRRAVGNRHQEHRMLSFKDSESWMKYADKYGADDYYASIMSHIELMSREIAAMETFGPNPDIMMKQLKMMAQQEVGKQRGGSAAKSVGWLAENSYILTMGRQFSNHTKISDAFRGVRNVVTGMRIGSAAISALSDLAFLGKTLRFNDLPLVKTYTKFLRNLVNSKEGRMTANRLGVTYEYALDRARAAHRISEVTGAGASARFADVVVRASGLNYWTNVAKQTFGLEFLSSLSDLSNTRWGKLSSKTRRAFERYGISEDDWMRMASSQKYKKEGVEFLDPVNFGDDDLTAKVIGMIREEMSFAVPEPNAKARAILTGGQPAGTPLGEIARLMGQFKSFPVTIMTTHLARGLNMPTGMSRMKYLASLFMGTTLLGGLAIQAKQVAAGKEPMDWKDPGFLISAIAQGGGGGILGDFLFMDHSRFGALSEWAMGPTVGEFEILMRTFFGTGRQALEGEQDIAERFGGSMAQLYRDFVPQVWYTKLVTQRYLNDWVEEMLDPNWHARQRRATKRMSKEYDQKWWWRPGTTSPQGSPFE